jgi:hypothetical protein
MQNELNTIERKVENEQRRKEAKAKKSQNTTESKVEVTG